MHWCYNAQGLGDRGQGYMKFSLYRDDDDDNGYDENIDDDNHNDRS